MALAMEFNIGKTKIRIMDDCCSAPDQKERDEAIRRKVYGRALEAIRANPERYYKVLEGKEADENTGRNEGIIS